MPYNRILSGTQLLLMKLVRKNEAVCGIQAQRAVKKFSDSHNGGVLLMSFSACNRTLAILEEKGYLYSYEDASVSTRGIMRKMYSMTLEGSKILDWQTKLIDGFGKVVLDN